MKTQNPDMPPQPQPMASKLESLATGMSSYPVLPSYSSTKFAFQKSPELHLQILYYIPDMTTLHFLVLASSSFKTLCNTGSVRQQVVTAVTINQLLAQGLDILTPAPLVEVRLRILSPRIP